MGIPDTGASKHFLQTKTISTCTDIKMIPKNSQTAATAADGGQMQATHQVKVPLSPALTDKAKSAYVLDNLSTGSLVSIGQLCDDDCVALFSKYDVKIIKTGKQSLKGKGIGPMDYGPSH